MQLLDKYIYIYIFLQGINKKSIFTKPSSTHFEITFIQVHFAKTTLSFSVITKILILLALQIFKSFTQTHTSFTLNKHIFHTNKIYV
jgi:hypothetical protein